MKIRLTEFKMNNGAPLALQFFGAGVNRERAFAAHNRHPGCYGSHAVSETLQSFIQAAVDQHGLAGDVRSALRSEPHDRLRDLAGIAQSPEWSIGGPGIEHLLLTFS